jgi:hypothetical protein
MILFLTKYVNDYSDNQSNVSGDSTASYKLGSGATDSVDEAALRTDGSEEGEANNSEG